MSPYPQIFGHTEYEWDRKNRNSVPFSTVKNILLLTCKK